MFLSEWREFPSATYLAGKRNLMTARVSMLLKSRASLTCFRAFFLPGRAKDLSAPRQNSHYIEYILPVLQLKQYLLILTFVFPCIASTITIDNQQDADSLIYSLLAISTFFGRFFRPSSGAYHCNYSLW